MFGQLNNSSGFPNIGAVGTTHLNIASLPDLSARQLRGGTMQNLEHASDKQRSRRQHSKVRSGCDTCRYSETIPLHRDLRLGPRSVLTSYIRQRRVKCDEGHPTCER